MSLPKKGEPVEICKKALALGHLRIEAPNLEVGSLFGRGNIHNVSLFETGCHLRDLCIGEKLKFARFVLINEPNELHGRGRRWVVQHNVERLGRRSGTTPLP